MSRQHFNLILLILHSTNLYLLFTLFNDLFLYFVLHFIGLALIGLCPLSINLDCLDLQRMDQFDITVADDLKQ